MVDEGITSMGAEGGQDTRAPGKLPLPTKTEHQKQRCVCVCAWTRNEWLGLGAMTLGCGTGRVMGSSSGPGRSEEPGNECDGRLDRKDCEGGSMCLVIDNPMEIITRAT